MAYPPEGSWPLEPPTATEPFDLPFRPPRPPKFRGRLWLHGLLLALTILSTTAAGAGHYLAFVSAFGPQTGTLDGAAFVHGFWYSGTLLAILGAHEMGHYLLCRRYNVDATLPYFIPVPILLTGTLGAVIKIREAFPTRRVLFDIGVAGPIAGFIVVVPAVFYGMSLSALVPAPMPAPGMLTLGEPLLFRWATHVIFGTVPQGSTVNMHPMVFAAWFGMLATSWNLLPFGQFDGGHLTYATLGRRVAKGISLVTMCVAIVMVYVSLSWLLMTIMMLVMVRMFGLSHPPVLNEYEPLPQSRVILAVVGVIIFVLCFMPVPLEPYDLG